MCITESLYSTDWHNIVNQLYFNKIYICVYVCKYIYIYVYIWASLIAQSIKNLPAMKETWVRFLGQEDALEKKMATHSSILAWRIPWTEEPGRLQSMGSQELDTTTPQPFVYIHIWKNTIRFLRMCVSVDICLNVHLHINVFSKVWKFTAQGIWPIFIWL